MTWFRVVLNDPQQEVVREESLSHPQRAIRQRMLALWLLHCGLKRQEAAQGTQVSRATVGRLVAAFRDQGLEGVRRWDTKGPVSTLAEHDEAIVASLREQPARTVAEAAQRIEQLTGLRRGPTQVRKFLRDRGLRWQRTRAVPVPPQKVSRNTAPFRRSFYVGS